MVLEKVLLKSLSFSAGGSTYGMTRSSLLMSFFEAMSAAFAGRITSVMVSGVVKAGQASKV